MQKAHIFFFNLLLSIHIHQIITQNEIQKGDSDSSDGILESPLCCNLTVEQVDVDYSSKIVENEYIVMFNGYYKNQARAAYILTALNGTGVKKWSIVARENPASDYPSDFDVIILEDTYTLEGEAFVFSSYFM